MPRLFRLEVHTPYRLFFSGMVRTVVTTIADGEIGILAGHTPVIAPLRTGALRILREDGVWVEAAVSPGMVVVSDSGTTVLSGAAEWPAEIDRERALAARARAEERLAGDAFTFEKEVAKSGYERARNRLAIKDRAKGEKIS